MRILVVGAGFAGSTFARLAAEDGNKVIVIDKKEHIGGNSYSFEDSKTGIEIHKYGPHIFHTNDEDVYSFITKFTEFNNYINRVKAISNGKVYSLPINLHTINQFFNKTFSPKEAEDFIEKKREKYKDVLNFEEFVKSSLGTELYEAFFRDYTIKQWGVEPKEISVSTAKRLPIRFNYDDNYFNDKYQGIPIKGYGALFEEMLNNENINIKLNTSFGVFNKNNKIKFDFIVYTGSIDEYFDYKYGYLPYRSITFEEMRGEEIQGNAVINYTDMSENFTRIHEHKYFTPEKKFKQSIAFKEYSFESDSRKNPFYPIENIVSTEMVMNYKKLSKLEDNVVFIGRLAEYKYMNMDQVIRSSIDTYRKIMKDCNNE